MHKSQWSDTILAYGRSDSFWEEGEITTSRREQIEQVGRERKSVAVLSVEDGDRKREREQGI